MPNRQTPLDPEGQRESERRGGLHVYCPCCGHDLIEAGKITRKEVLNEVSHRRSHRRNPHNSPQSSVDTCNGSVCIPSVEGVSGTGGMGGSDPDGGLSER